MCRNIFRHSATIATVLLAALALGGCTAESTDVPEVAEGGLTIRFYSAKVATRADEITEPGILDYNENKITSLVVGLYDASLDDDHQPGAFRIYRGLAAQNSYQCRISLRREEINLLFGSGATTGATCKVYAVANLPEETLNAIQGKMPSVNQLKAISVTGQFDELRVQHDFIMTGTSVATYTADSAGASATGEVPLVRTAAKITLNIKLPEKIQDSEESDVYWWPLGGNEAMRVLLNEGVKTAAAETVLTTDSDIPEANYFDITTRNDNIWGFSSNPSEANGYTWKQTYPFYTYPNHWQNSPSEMHKTTLTLIIPWQEGTKDGPKEGSSYETFYYSVPVTPTEVTEIVSNHSYQIDLYVNMLGSRSPEMPEEIEGTYKIVDWQTQPSDVVINDSRYLIINPRIYEVNGLDEFTLRFYSSHAVEVEDITMRYNRFAYITSTSNPNIGAVVSFPTSFRVINRSITGKDSLVSYTKEMNTRDPKLKQYTFNLKHELKIWTPLDEYGATVSQTGKTTLRDTTTVQNSIYRYERPSNPDDAYSPYVFEVTLRHKDKQSFKETFTVIQYPSMWIKAVRNSGINNGNVYVNYNGRSNDDDLGGVHGLTGTGNQNPNMYILTVSKLNKDSKYYIGDPRVLYYNNLNSTSNNALQAPTSNGNIAQNWCKNAPALYDKNGNRRLKYYYPTDERDDDYHKMMIAPQIRVASSYGVTQPVSRNEARRRCATYQEENCPAGRWRLPTYGEMLYIVELSSNNKIPVLFSTETDYWSAQGAYQVTTSGTLTPGSDYYRYVRCVYDEWYWKDETAYTISPNGQGRYTYTLGDMPKRNAQN